MHARVSQSGSIPSFATSFCLPFHNLSLYYSLSRSCLIYASHSFLFFRHVPSKKQRLVSQLASRCTAQLALLAVPRLPALSVFVSFASHADTRNRTHSNSIVEDSASSPLTVVSDPFPIAGTVVAPLLLRPAVPPAVHFSPLFPCRSLHPPRLPRSYRLPQ